MKEKNTKQQKEVLMTLKEVAEQLEAGILSRPETYISDAERIACGMPVIPEQERITDEMYIVAGIPLMSQEEVASFKK